MATQPNRAPTFESILDTPAQEYDRPKPLPVGTYDCVVQGLPEYGESSQKKTPFVRFTLSVQAVGADVDEAEAEAMGGLVGKTIKATYYTTPDAIFRLMDFLEHCGLDVEREMSKRAMIDETPNCSVRAIVSHRASEDGQQIFAEVKRTMKAE